MTDNENRHVDELANDVLNMYRGPSRMTIRDRPEVVRKLLNRALGRTATIFICSGG